MADAIGRGFDLDERVRLHQCAELIASRARQIASLFSRRIPAATRVKDGRTGSAFVVTDGQAAPNAAPFEYAEYHPLFGNEEFMYKQPHRPYMEVAANEMASAAAEEFANVIDDWCRRLGYER